ncbi:YlzJ-like protein [Hydrogenispora ethanolica]|jgi:hypothetical protein|uniref:YlzJ-like protein n=1 Tax=Hydrogenispora ethanolica TaxID=1082276 RepID=A0A4R1R7F2_HYDET|nr:YlzJ-like protein [Hydrogenispora ethanolica]
MLLYTVIPPELIFEDDSGENSPCEPVEVKKGAVSLMVQPLSAGQGRITRVISTDPQDFLNPEWQPGTIMSIF